MPYGPLLWGPFVVAQLLRLDFRIFTIIGQIFVPLWCGIVAIVEAGRGRVAPGSPDCHSAPFCRRRGHLLL